MSKLQGKVTKFLGLRGIIIHNSRSYTFSVSDTLAEVQKGSRVLFALNDNEEAIQVELDTTPIPAVRENMHPDNETAIREFKKKQRGEQN